MERPTSGGTYQGNSARGRNVFGNTYDSGNNSRSNSKNNSRHNSNNTTPNTLNLIVRDVLVTIGQRNCIQLVKYPQRAISGHSMPEYAAKSPPADRYRIEHLIYSLDHETVYCILIDTANRYPIVARVVEAEVELRARIQPLERLKPKRSDNNEYYKNSSNREIEDNYPTSWQGSRFRGGNASAKPTGSQSHQSRQSARIWNSRGENKTDRSYGSYGRCGSYGIGDSETDEDSESQDSGSETSSFYEDEHDEQVYTMSKSRKSWCRRKFSRIISSGMEIADCLTEMVLDGLQHLEDAIIK